MEQINNDFEEQKVKKCGFLNEFLWTCAGVNKKVLRQCPTDYAKYAGIGGTILFTALMAMLSGGYAMFTVFNNSRIAVVFGVFWGLLIFNLDRFIVNTMYSDGKSTISWMEVLSGLPRIIMAIFLGIVISMPLELKIFEDEIKVVIAEQVQERIKKYQEQDNGEIAILQAKRDSILNYRSELMNAPLSTDWTLGNNEQINTLITEKNQADAQWKQLNSEVKEKQRRRQVLLQNETPQDSVSAKRISNDILQLKKHIYDISHSINQLNSKIQSLSDENKEIVETARKQRDTELDRLKTESDEISQTIKDLKESISNDGYKDLIEGEYGGFQAKMSAFSKMKKDNKTTKMAALFIMLLFVIIETAPTFFKMMMENGPYDDLLFAVKHETKVMSQKRISDVNDFINSEIQISTEKNKNRIEAEIKANQDVLDGIATAQAELIQVAIDAWREEELAKIQANPSDYIRTNMSEVDNQESSTLS